MFKPPLKWAGGKRWLVSQLKPIWEENTTRRYVEPFCGGLAVVLGLQPRTALLNDVNPHLINFYRHVQNGSTNRRVEFSSQSGLSCETSQRLPPAHFSGGLNIALLRSNESAPVDL